MKCKKIIMPILPVIFLVLATSLLLTGVLGASSTNNTNSSSNSSSVSWIYDGGLTGIAVTDVNISKDSSKDSGITVTGIIENNDPDATKLAVTINLHMYDKTNDLLGIIPVHPADILKPLQKIHFVVKDPTRQTVINLDHVYLQVRAFDCGTASVKNVGCFGQTVNVTKKDTNDTEKKLPLVKTTLPTGVFDSKELSASNLSAVGNGDSYDILGKIKNISNETKQRINLIVEIYNSTNHLVGVDQGYPIFTTLRPKEESAFKVNTNVPTLSNDHYVVTVGALESANSQPFLNTTLSNTTIDNNNNNDTSESEKPRTFNDCNSDLVLGTLILSVLTPTNINLTDLANPEVKTFFTYLCNFYHEKTGVWAGITNFQEYGDKYGVEFVQKYNATIPETIRELIKDLNQTRDN
jgi:hypothetical protein